MARRSKISEGILDRLANDGTLARIAMQLAINDGVDWPSLDDESKDAWTEAAIAKLRRGEISRRGF